MTNEARSSKGTYEYMQYIDTVREIVLEIHFFRFLPTNAPFRHSASENINLDFVKTQQTKVLMIG
jgi:hypothetical protein